MICQAELKLTEHLVVAMEETVAMACEMSAWEEWFLDMMDNLSEAPGWLSLLGSWHDSPGSCCISPSSHGRSLGHGGSTTGGPGPSSSKVLAQGQEDGARKGKGKVKMVEELEEESGAEEEDGSEEGDE